MDHNYAEEEWTAEIHQVSLHLFNYSELGLFNSSVYIFILEIEVFSIFGSFNVQSAIYNIWVN